MSIPFSEILLTSGLVMIIAGAIIFIIGNILLWS